MLNQIEIRYCTQCSWLLRAAWYGQELLTTFSHELDGGLTLLPGTGGIFEIRANGKTIWSRSKDGGFPEIAELKRRVRDEVAPGRELGHLDRKKERITGEVQP